MSIDLDPASAAKKRVYLGCRQNVPSQPVQPEHPTTRRYPPISTDATSNAKAQSIAASHSTAQDSPAEDSRGQRGELGSECEAFDFFLEETDEG